MNKGLVASFAVLFSSYAANSVAALPTGTSQHNLSVPCSCGRLILGLSALYWGANRADLDYALTFPAASFGDTLSGGGDFRKNSHDHDWGIRANIGYVFLGTANDVNVVCTHWDASHDHLTHNFGATLPSVSAPFFAEGFFPVVFPASSVVLTTGPITGVATVGLVVTTTLPGFTFEITPNDIEDIEAHSWMNNNSWDVEFGQAINVGCNFHLRLFAGARYARLKHGIDIFTDFAAAGTATVSPVSATAAVVGPITVDTIAVTVSPVFDVTASLQDIVTERSHFNGGGPRFGIDASYHLGCGFGVVAGISAALLVGQTESDYSELITALANAVIVPATTTVTLTTGSVLSDPSVPVTSVSALTPMSVSLSKNISFKHAMESRIVPNIDAKLGIDWSYQFCNCSHSIMTVAAGYRVSHYFSAIDSLSGIEAFAPEMVARQVLGVSFEGPYVAVLFNL
jgi:hypothetical protein